MEWQGDNALGKIPPRLVSILSQSLQQSENLIVELDRVFHIDTEYAPDVLFVMPNHAVVINEKELSDQRLPMTSADFIPITGMSRYRIEDCEGSVSMSREDHGSDDPNNDPSWDLKFDRMIANPSSLRSLIVDKFPSLDIWLDDDTPNPIFCAVSIKGNFCDILGAYQLDNGALSGDEDISATAEAVSLITTSIHETAAELSKFRVIVHASIFDRVANEDVSIPVAFLDKEAGGLEHPMHVRISKKICKEMNLVPDVEFCIFRDRNHLFVTVTAPNISASMVRIPFADLTNPQGRINGQKVRSALTKAMALKRDKTGISSTSFTRQRRGWQDSDEKVGTRIGLGLKLATMNAVFGEATGDEARWKVMMNNENAKMFYSLVPVMLHLCLARFDPSLRGEIRTRAEPRGRKPNRRMSMRRHLRLYDWGTDSIRYISEGEGDTRSRHWVITHLRRIKISSPKTIRNYETKGFPVIRNEDGVIGYRVIRGHYRGSGIGADWNGDYKFGKSPSYYSKKAIRWLRSIEVEEGISIQHAEKGGEWRIPIGESHIQIDGWCKETNTAYEFHGDVYHGNPSIYSEDDLCHPHDKSVTAGELYEKTMQKEFAITSRGFNLVTMWESDWDKIERSLLSRTSA